ncbi:MAG: glycoside hydrolase family 32 protein [Clostridia bacterium]|nr:glycoside hydrolase family 32 protein [Clostridia bacterium]
MKVQISKRYMLLPVSEGAQMKKVFLREEGVIRVELALRLSDAPDCVMPYDMRRFLGRTLEFSTEPATGFAPSFADSPDESGLYREKYRPAAHFTARRGWINDPNGLVWYEGRFHMFFQHNPVDTVWGNMHWGHAVSDDLVRWTETEEALFPDENGAMFSGSAVVDSANASGLRQGGHDPLLLFYTAAGGAGEMSRGALSTQRMAYSVDGGRTFVKYEKPIIDTIAPANRDPKVVWCEELNQYLLALYLEGRAFCLFTSPNLLDWTELQRVFIEEDDECPDIYPLSADGERYWVMTAAHDRYVIGRFEGGHFVPLMSTGRLHYGLKSYAAQTFFGAPDGRRIRFGWNQARIPGMPFTGSMTTPHDMSLKRVDGALKLCAWPSPEFEALRGERREGEGCVPLSGRANDIELLIPAAGRRALRLFGLELTVDGDAGAVVKENGARRVFGDAENDAVRMPVRREGGFIRLRVIQDVHAVEIYAGDGDATLCLQHVSDGLLNRVECEGARITAWALKNIHE